MCDCITEALLLSRKKNKFHYNSNMWKPISTLFQVKGGQFRFRVIATLPYSVTFISYKTIIFIDSYSS